MKPTICLLTVAIAVGLNACTESKSTRQAALLSQSEATLMEFNTILDGITDVDSATAARANLERVSKQLADVSAELQKTGEVSEEVMTDFKERIKPTTDKISANMIRFNEDPAVLTEISQAMMTIMTAAQQSQGNEAPEGSSARYTSPPESQ